MNSSETTDRKPETEDDHASEYPVKKLLPLTNDMMQEIDDFRTNKRIASEDEAIRILLMCALAELKSDAKKTSACQASFSYGDLRHSALFETPFCDFHNLLVSLKAVLEQGYQTSIGSSEVEIIELFDSAKYLTDVLKKRIDDHYAELNSFWHEITPRSQEASNGKA